MKFVSITPVAYEVSSGTALFVVALDDEGEIWWLDTNEGLPGPRWHPLPIHPRQPTGESAGTRKRRRR